MVTIMVAFGLEDNDKISVNGRVFLPTRLSPSRNVQPENIHRNGKSLNY